MPGAFQSSRSIAGVGGKTPTKPTKFFVQDKAPFSLGLVVGAWDDPHVDQYPAISFMWLVRTMQYVCEAEQFNWGWPPPTPGAMGGTQLMGFRGYWALRAAMGSEIDNWSFKPPVVPVVEIGADDSPEQYSVLARMIDDVDMFGFDLPIVATPEEVPFVVSVTAFGRDDLGIDTPIALMAFDVEQPTWVSMVGIQGTDEDTAQSAFFALEQFGEVQELSVPQQLAYFVPDLDADFDTAQSTFFALEQYADIEIVGVGSGTFSVYDSEQFGFDSPQINTEEGSDQFWSQRVIADEEPFGFDSPTVQVIVGSDDWWQAYGLVIEDSEQFSFNPVVTQVVEIGVDASLDQIAQQVGPAIGDSTENFNWGYSFNISGAGGTQLMGFRGFNSLKGAIGSEEIWSFNLGAVVKVGIDDAPDQVSEKPRFIVDDVEMFGFNPPVVQVVEIGVDASIDQLPLQYVILDGTEEFNWGFNLLVMGGGGQDISEFRGFWSLRAAMGSDIDNWSLELPLATQDSEYVFTPPVFQAAEDDYFSFQPPVVKVNEDDVAYNSIPQALSFYFTSLETEQFDWGFRQPPATVSEDDNPYDSSPRLISFIPEIEDEMFNWGFKPPTAATNQDDVPYNYPPQQISLYFSKLEAEQFDWGFNPPVIKITADSDELPVMGRISFDHEFDWSFNPPFSFDQDELPVISKVLFDHEFDWGFNPPIVTAKSGFDQDDLPNQTQVIFGYEVDWGFQPVGLGGAGHDMAGFRGYRSLKGAMGSEDQWSFSTPVIVVHTISFDQNVVRKMHHHVDEGLDIGLGDLLIIIPLAVFATGAVLSSIDSGQVTSGIIVAGKVTFVKGS